MLRFAGEATLPAGLPFEGTVVGGLSSISYDATRDVYYALSDAQPNLGQGPFRFYTLRINTSDGALGAGATPGFRRDDPGPTRSVSVLAPGTVDPEGLTLTDRDTLVITSEGFATPATATTPANVVPPFVREFGLDGRQLRWDIDLPAYVDPVLGTRGVRNNLGLESAALTPNGRFLFTGFENALVQDGPASTLATGSPSRLLRIDAVTGALQREYVYPNHPVAEPPLPAGQFTVNGLVELLPRNAQFLLSMERSFSVGAFNTVRIHRVALAGATDVSGVADLDDAGTVRPVGKRLLVDLDNLGLTLDNLEGMTLGPRLPDGGRALILMSDNNFAAGQVSQFSAVLRATHRPVGVPRRSAPTYARPVLPALRDHRGKPAGLLRLVAALVALGLLMLAAPVLVPIARWAIRRAALTRVTSRSRRPPSRPGHGGQHRLARGVGVEVVPAADLAEG